VRLVINITVTMVVTIQPTAPGIVPGHLSRSIAYTIITMTETLGKLLIQI